MSGDTINSIILILSAIGGLIFSRLFLRPLINKLEIGKRLTNLRYPEYGRQLSNDELLWADQAAREVFNKVTNEYQFGLIGNAVFLICFLVLLVFFMLVFCGVTILLITTFHQNVNPSALSWYRIETVGASTIIALFAGIFATGWAPTAFTLRFLDLTKYFKSYFKNYHKNTHGYWKSVALDLIRKRKIPAHNKMSNIQTIVRTPYKNFADFCGAGMMLAGGLAAFFLIFDLNFKTVFYPDHIEHSPYLSLSTSNYMAQNIIRVERTCRIVVKTKNQSRPRAKLKYKLVMADGRKVTLYGGDEGANLRNQIHALEHWHNTIPAHLISPTNISSSHTKKISPTERECASVLNRYSYSGYNQELLKYFDLPI